MSEPFAYSPNGARLFVPHDEKPFISNYFLTGTKIAPVELCLKVPSGGAFCNQLVQGAQPDEKFPLYLFDYHFRSPFCRGGLRDPAHGQHGHDRQYDYVQHDYH
jgi:hypothetical protein